MTPSCTVLTKRPNDLYISGLDILSTNPITSESNLTFFSVSICVIVKVSVLRTVSITIHGCWIEFIEVDLHGSENPILTNVNNPINTRMITPA